MKCPKCNEKTKVVDSGEEFGKMMRRRKCKKCGYTFTTQELFLDDEWLWRRERIKKK